MNDLCKNTSLVNYSFEDFRVGDVAIFNRTFSVDEFEAFEKLSGDSNPLYCNSAYAKTTKFSQPIVPLHLIIAPLSRVAGMIFPGNPSLYLGHEVRASQPVYYGDSLTYSAKIDSINRPHRILTIRVIAIRNTEIVLDALMRVQSLQDEWQSPLPRAKVIKSGTPAYALVTGSSGEIGKAIALALAGEGWKLILQDRGADSRRKELGKALDRFGACYEFIASDLCCKQSLQAVAKAIKEKDETLGLIVHTASSGVKSSLDELVATNYSALKTITEAALPGFLSKQTGIVLLISSIHVYRSVIGWDNYTAAKTMATGYISGIDRIFSVFGVRGISILPGAVATGFSAPYRGETPALLPEELAAETINIIKEPDSGVVTFEIGTRQKGYFGIHFFDIKANTKASGITYTASSSEDETGSTSNSVKPTVNIREKLKGLIKYILRTPDAEDLNSGGLGITPGWDSLSQIEIIIAIESEFGVSFSSDEISELTQYGTLEKMVLRKLGEA